MTMMASQIINLTVVYSILYSGADQRKIKALRHWPLCREFTGTSEFPAQRASNGENVSIWWRHQEAGALRLGMNPNMDFNICFSNTGHRYYNIWKNISYNLTWHILEVLTRETSTCIQVSILQVFSKYIAQLYPTLKIKYPDLEN